MNILTNNEIINLKIIRDEHGNTIKSGDGIRATTYDATIGKIITKGGEIEADTFVLKPRGIAWVISKEMFHLPKTVTGITTLRTSWTRKGILTLTVGIVDPEYNGPLSTALINFGSDDFCIEKEKPFFRTAFFNHQESCSKKREETMQGYRNSVVKDTISFSDTFLTMDSLGKELIPEIWKIPRWGLYIGIFGLGLAIFGMILPQVTSLSKEVFIKNTKIENLEMEITNLKKEIDELKKQ